MGRGGLERRRRRTCADGHRDAEDGTEARARDADTQPEEEHPECRREAEARQEEAVPHRSPKGDNDGCVEVRQEGVRHVVARKDRRHHPRELDLCVAADEEGVRDRHVDGKVAVARRARHDLAAIGWDHSARIGRPQDERDGCDQCHGDRVVEGGAPEEPGGIAQESGPVEKRDGGR
jgi:hypothetical protein